MHLSPISEEAGGYGYGSARDDSFFGFLNGCWFVDFPLGNGKLAKVFFSSVHLCRNRYPLSLAREMVGKPLLGPYELEGMMLA